MIVITTAQVTSNDFAHVELYLYQEELERMDDGEGDEWGLLTMNHYLNRDWE